ncbi:MAG: 2-oxoacid:acceptor oxidoreductase family protein [Melioribacteraceae bacterium]|nr:2-oxoacid:acceptor oxidoreductase family protein [Melioribacteraceae bacterium]
MSKITEEKQNVVIKFAGDSGDGMQLTGTQFSNTSAQMGNDLATFPDYPSEIRAPLGTIAGVSGFQVCIGSSEISTPGDRPDVLVAMNPAALKANLKDVKKPAGIIVVNSDAFTAGNLKKANYSENPLEDGSLSDYTVYPIAITTLTLEALKEVDLDKRAKARSKNLCALGITYYMFDRNIDSTVDWIKSKFSKLPKVSEANILALKAGWNFGENANLFEVRYQVPQAKIQSGKYRQISGNVATAWGLMQAAKSADLPLFLGSYPITPATEILQELAKFKEFGVKTFQAEDEIAGVCTAIGASFAGHLGVPQDFVDKIGADAYGANAASATEKAKELAA